MITLFLNAGAERVVEMAVEELRAADVDRERVVERLRRAQAEGRIDLFEFDERVAAAYAARTYADLDPLTRDLPPQAVRPARPARSAPPARPPRPAGPVRPGGGRRDGWAVARRIQLVCWLLAGLVNVMIWAAVSVGAGVAVYPWWVWVVGPWGVMLLIEQSISKVARCH
jgi:hypothetical protein